MEKKLQISFLWLAGLLILAHQFIPHHHHETESDSCAIETKAIQHTHSTELSDNHSCHCNHAENHTGCELDFKSIKKHHTPTFLLFVANIPKTNACDTKEITTFHPTDDNLTYHQYLFEHKLRGPPQLS